MYKVKREYYYKANETETAVAHYNSLIANDVSASMYANTEGIMITTVTMLPEKQGDAKDRGDYFPAVDEWSGD